MFDYAHHIEENPGGVLSTRNGERVDARVFQALFVEDGNVYFCTSSEKPVYAQLMASPNASFCTNPQGFAPVLTVNGKVGFVEDAALKAQVMAQSAVAKRNYQTPDNPIFKVFYLAVEEVKTYTFAAGTERQNM